MLQQLYKSKRFVFLIILITISTVARSQITVTGTVTDAADGLGIPGATVLEKGTNNGTITDFEGRFSLNVAGEESVLVISFVGYTTLEQTIGTQTSLSFALSESIEALEEIVVVGYGVQKKKEITGAVSSVKSDVILKTATSDVNTSLQGAVAGVNVSASSGAPGASSNIQIRGLGSFSGAGASPLYIVDGIPYSGNPNLSPAEVESVEVLKDGASAAIYGTRASNGVILITTKKGVAGKLNVEYSGYYGIQNITSGVPLMNNLEQITASEAFQRSLDGTSSQVTALNRGALETNTDFVGAILNDNAPITNHDLILSGGKDDVTFSSVINYFNQDGVLNKSGYERLSARINTNVKKGKFDGFASLAVRAVDSESEPFGIYQNAIFQKPYVPLPEGEGVVSVPYENPQNIGNFANQLVNDDFRNSQDINAAMSLKYEIIDGLSYMLRIGGNMTNYSRKYWQPSYIVIAENGEMENLSSRPDAILQETYNGGNKWTIENVLNYTKSFNRHNLTVTAAYTAERSTFKQTIAEKTSFLSNTTQVFNAGSVLSQVSGYENANSLVGLMGRVLYNFDEKYMVSASIRRDGSSNFGPGNRFAVFPGVSLGWLLSEEGFYKNTGLADVMNSVKIRGSYAEVGNQNIGSYLYSAQIEQGSNYPFGPETNGTLTVGAIQRKFANQDIKWERNLSRNIGIDFQFLRGALTFNVDVYNNSKRDMLLPVELVPSVGTWIPNSSSYNTVIQNVGDMVNKGVELTLNYRNKENEFKWDISGTFTRNTNEVTSVPEGFGEFALGGGNPIPANPRNDNTTFLSLNRPVASFLLIETDGIITTQEELEAYNASIIGGGFRLGDLKYVDANGDSVINSNDRKYMGNGTPEFEIGVGFNADYKGFDFYTQLYYAQGAEIYNGAKAQAYQTGRHKDFLSMWQPSNPNSPIPVFRNNSADMNFRTWSDYFLEDGTYLRFRIITLGYTFPNELFQNKIELLRVYLSAQNPFTITSYTGFDPEVGYTQYADVRGGGGNTLFNRGVDRGNYPISRRFIVGLSFKF